METIPLALIVAMAAVFLGVAVVVGATTTAVFERRTPERRRLRRLAQPADKQTLVDQEKALVVNDAAEMRRARTFVPKSPREIGRLRRRLMRAGYRTLWPTVVYFWAEILLPVSLGLGALWYFGSSGWLIAAFVAVLGYLVPGLILAHLIKVRKLELQNGLADALDLLIVCVEAWSSLDQAVLKTADELAVSYPALADELKTLNIEVRAGKPRLEAFRNLASRTGLDDVRALVAMLVQTDRFGTSVSQARRLREIEAAIFCIGLGPNINPETLKQLAAESGGDVYFPQDVSTLTDDYRRIVENLRRRYMITYESTNSSVDGSKPAICGHRKTGHFGRPETAVEFYFMTSCVRKVVWTLVRQLRGPHLSTCA